jgi:serine/threonine protein phosphatase PrpC
MKFGVFKYSDKGPRVENQDSMSVAVGDELVACVADGVGGSDCGKLAAETSVDNFISKVQLFRYDLKSVLLYINQRLKDLQVENSNCSNMATTFTGCFISLDKLHGVHVGDSRLCILRGNGIKQLTEDHTEANSLFKKGKLTFEESRNYVRKNILESALQGIEDFTYQLFEFGIAPGDRILLTTDGVHGIVGKSELRDLSVTCKSLNEFGESLLSVIRSKRIVDNFTFVLIEIQ